MTSPGTGKSNGGSDRMPPARVAATLVALRAQLVEDQTKNIGYPGSFDFDYTSLLELFNLGMNNIGDPYMHSAYPSNCMALERQLIAKVADLLGAPVGDRWGYVTTGGTEGNQYGLYLARERYPTGMAYHSRAAHYSVPKALDFLRMPAIAVDCDRNGVLDYQDLERLLRVHREVPAIILATAGTTMTEAVDDVTEIRRILDSIPIRRSHIHVDAALSGLPLAFIPRADRPGFDMTDGADSISVSGHKFIGSPFPCGLVLTRRSLRERIGAAVDYIGTADTTLTGSRSGHAALVLWYAVETLGVQGLRLRAEKARRVAAYACAQLEAISWPVFRHPHAFTVVFDSPPRWVVERWRLATGEGRSHLIAMPGVTVDQIDGLVSDLVRARNRPDETPTAPVLAQVPRPRAPFPFEDADP